MKENKRILIVDDDKNTQDLFKQYLSEDKEDGFIIDAAGSGEEALAKIKGSDEPYALIFMDIRMKDMDGIQTTKAVREIDHDVEIVICTGHNDYSLNDIAKELGKNNNLLYLCKPANGREVLQTARTLMDKYQQSQENRKYTENLEKLVQERTKELTLLQKQKNRFFAAMSHEMRTPLNGILGSAELLLQTNLDDEQNECAYQISSAGKTLLVLVGQTLDFSKAEAGKIDLENIEFKIRHLIDETIKNLSYKAEEKGLNLCGMTLPEVPEYLIGDPHKIRQILQNLFENAIKFTKKGDVILQVIREDSKETDIANIKFKIYDSGIGVNRESIDNIFQPFQQNDASIGREYKGTGLGLPICKKLVELMEGEIGIVSKKGEGSLFWFNLNLKVGKNTEQSPKENPSTLSGIKCSVFSDLSDRSILKSQIENLGGSFYRIDKFSDPDNENPDVIIVDLGKNKDYKDAAMIMKSKNTRNSNVPLICITSSPQSGDGKYFSEIGYSGYLTKPITQTQLIQTIHTVLNSKKDIPLVTRHSIKELYSNRKVLVAEDQMVNRMLLLKILGKLNIQCDYVVNGKEAVNAVKENDYGLILMDCMMPEMSGQEATSEIRKTGNKVPIIALTAHTDPKNKIECKESGMNDYYTKPINKKMIEEILDKYLQ